MAFPKDNAIGISQTTAKTIIGDFSIMASNDLKNQKVRECSGAIVRRTVFGIEHFSSGVIQGKVKSCASSNQVQIVSFCDGQWVVIGRFA